MNRLKPIISFLFDYKVLILIFVIVIFFTRYFFSVFIIYTLPARIWQEATPTGLFSVPRVFQNLSPSYHIYDLWAKWDTNYYLRIAVDGYDRVKFNTNSYHNWAFYPLYPLLVFIFTWVWGDLSYKNALVSGVIVSNIAIYINYLIVYKVLSNLKVPKDKIYGVIIFLLAFPAAYFTSIAYTESLFLLLMISMFYFLFKERYLISSLCIGLAMITKPIGYTLVFPFAYFYLSGLFYQNNFKFSSISKIVLYSFVSLLPIALFFYHLKSVSGNFFASFDIQKVWDNGVKYPFAIVIDYLNAYSNNLLIQTIFIVVSFISLIIFTLFYFLKLFHPSFKKLPANVRKQLVTMTIFLCVYTFSISSIGSMASIIRYSLPGFQVIAIMSVIWSDFKISKLLSSLGIFILVAIQCVLFTFFLLLIGISSF